MTDITGTWSSSDVPACYRHLHENWRGEGEREREKKAAHHYHSHRKLR